MAEGSDALADVAAAAALDLTAISSPWDTVPMPEAEAETEQVGDTRTEGQQTQGN